MNLSQNVADVTLKIDGKPIGQVTALTVGVRKTSPDLLNSMTDTEILDEAEQVVYDRPDTHGEPEDSFSRIARLWNSYLISDEFYDPNIDEEDVVNMMILLKVARNSEGHYHEDNYVDIAGYAENGARIGSDES